MKKEQINEIINKIYDFILDYSTKNGFPPSIREICAQFDIKSTATAYSYLEKLKSKGLLAKTPQKKRAVTVTNKNNFKSIALVGTITAGEPIFAVENLEGYYPLPPEFDGYDDVFALKVKGESMINAGINDKDIIIVKKQSTALNGEIVVALIEDSATVKRFYKKENKYVLHPENDAMDDIILDNVEIIGTVKGLIRKF